MLTDGLLIALNHELPARVEAYELASAWMDPSTGRTHLVGEIDFSNAYQIFEAIDRAVDLTTDVHMDLSRLEFLDCSALHYVSDLADKLNAEGQRLVLLFPHRILQRALEVTDLTDHPGLVVRNAASARDVTLAGEWIRLA